MRSLKLSYLLCLLTYSVALPWPRGPLALALALRMLASNLSLSVSDVVLDTKMLISRRLEDKIKFFNQSIKSF